METNKIIETGEPNLNITNNNPQKDTTIVESTVVTPSEEKKEEGPPLVKITMDDINSSAVSKINPVKTALENYFDGGKKLNIIMYDDYAVVDTHKGKNITSEAIIDFPEDVIAEIKKWNENPLSMNPIEFDPLKAMTVLRRMPKFKKKVENE